MKADGSSFRKAADCLLVSTINTSERVDLVHIAAHLLILVCIGNLSSEKVTKRDIFHVFHYYGDLAQISIKQAYGFVQFLRTDDCAKALEAEQGTQIRDKRIRESTD